VLKDTRERVTIVSHSLSREFSLTMQSPAFCNNNLAIDPKFSATFTVNEVALQAEDSNEVAVLSVDGNITSVNILGGDVIVTSTIGTSVFSGESRRLLFFFAIQASGDPKVEEYHQGSALIDGKRLCVGHCDGSINIFSKDSCRFSYLTSLQGENRAAIQCLHALTKDEGDWLVSGHSDGILCVWKPSAP
jgi:WD40 repeat protein